MATVALAGTTGPHGQRRGCRGSAGMRVDLRCARRRQLIVRHRVRIGHRSLCCCLCSRRHGSRVSNGLMQASARGDTRASLICSCKNSRLSALCPDSEAGSRLASER